MKRQAGFAVIVVIVVLVLLGGMAAVMISLGTAQQRGAAQDVLSARAWQAARAGNEWGLYQALKNNSCSSTHINLQAQMGFFVTVTCTSVIFNEGRDATGSIQPVTFYEIKAVACPSAAVCPDATAVSGPDYVERTRIVRASNP